FMCNQCRKLPGFLRIEGPKHIVYLSAFGIIISDAKTESWIMLSAAGCFDRFQTVVPGGGSFRFDTQGAKRDGEVIDDHQYIFYRHFQLLHPVVYGLTAKVHIRRRFNDIDLMSAVFKFCIIRMFENRPGCSGLICELISYHKTYIMAGVCIFFADISKTNNQKVHSIKVKSNSIKIKRKGAKMTPFSHILKR